jgi:hypothetical protein
MNWQNIILGILVFLLTIFILVLVLNQIGTACTEYPNVVNTTAVVRMLS